MVVLLVEKNIRILMYFFKFCFMLFIYFDCYFNRGCRKISRENGY